MIPFYLISRLHPWGLALFLICFNTLFFFVSFKVLKKIFGGFISIAFLSLWSINSLMAGYDSIPWWPIFIPLGTICIWYVLYKIDQENLYLWWIVLGLTLGFFINMHFQYVLIIIFSVFYLMLLHRDTKKISQKSLCLTMISFTSLFLPLFIFDLRHNFLNIKFFFKFFFSNPDNIPPDFSAWWPVFSNVIQPFTYIKSSFINLIFYVAVFLTLISLILKKKGYFKRFYFSTFFLWVIFPFFFVKYGRRPSEYYFLFLYPSLILIIVELISQTKNKVLIFSICFILMLAINAKGLSDNLRPLYSTLIYRDALIKRLAKQTRNLRFNIGLTTPLGFNHGFNYLFDYYQIKQSGDYNDPLVQVIIPPRKDCTFQYGNMGVIIPPELKINKIRGYD